MAHIKHDGTDDLFGGSFDVQFTAEELQAIRRPIKDADLPATARVWGGNQNLAFLIQQREHDGLGRYSDSEISDAFFKWLAYGNGTWQRYFGALVTASQRAGWSAAPALIEKAETRRREVLERGHSWAHL